MKIVQNYKKNILRSASDSTYIFLLKIKNSVWFLYPLPPVYPSKAQYFAVHCSTLYPKALCILCYNHFPLKDFRITNLLMESTNSVLVWQLFSAESFLLSERFHIDMYKDIAKL